MGAETQFRVAQLAHAFITIESVKDPGHYVALDLYGNVNGAKMANNEKQFIPRLVVSISFCFNIPVHLSFHSSNHHDQHY